jgi:hypothetical protein
MAVGCPKPIFAVILRENDQWTVEAEWPDGTIDEVVVVKSATAAWKWISHNSESWVRDRVDLLRPTT